MGRGSMELDTEALQKDLPKNIDLVEYREIDPAQWPSATKDDGTYRLVEVCSIVRCKCTPIEFIKSDKTKTKTK